jgi:hypothetical protein
MAKPKKASKSGTPGLPALTPEAAAAIQDQKAQVAAALDAGQDPESLKEMLAATTGDLDWDLNLMAALGGLARPGVPGLLAALFGTAADKTRRKALKRTLHLLKTRGVSVPEDLLPREEPAPLKAPDRGPALAYVSPVLGNGERYVILEGPKEILGGSFLVSRVSDTAGIQECHLLSLKSRQRQELWEHFREQGLTEWATPPPAYAVRLLEEANAKKPAAEGGSRYRSLQPRILQAWGRPEDAADAAALMPSFSPGEQSRLLDQSRDLARHPLFFTWLPGLQELTPWLQKLREVQESPIVLSDQQRQARMDGVVDEAVQDLYPPESRDDWRRRLLAMAYFLNLREQESEARLAQAAAQDLAAGPRGQVAGENPFLKALVWEAVKLAWEYQKQTQEKPASSLLAPASDPLLIRR